MDTYQAGCTLVCAFLLWAKQILGDSCYTPDGQQGHCVPLYECPKVFDIFANPPRGSETYLLQFLCTKVEQLKVCCGTAANFTILEHNPPRFGPKFGVIDIVYKKAFKYCSHDSLSNIDLAVIVRGSKDSNVEDKRCLGILVNPRYVVTPAQCIVSNTKGQQFTLVRVKFRGKNNDSPTFGIEEVISHPFFDPVSGTNDIALLRLNQSVSEGNVPVLCRGLLQFHYSSLWGESMFTYSNLALSTIERGLNKTTVSITALSKIACEIGFQKKGAHVVLTDYDVCLKNVKNVTKFTCNEFSGVPLFDEYSLGYVGFSFSRTVCKDGLPVIYTNLGAYNNWLIDQMKPWPINSDPCTTPNGEIGECWYLDHCPALLDAFSSVTNATEAFLNGFICEAEKKEFSVCCVTSSNSTIVLKKDELKRDDLPIKFLETRLCGMQHRDDYFSSSAAIAIDEFPWIAVIETSTFSSCTGTLINSRYVISTGYCVGQVYMYTAIVRLGDYNQFNETSCVNDPDIDATDCTETEKYGVEDIILHPFYTEFGLNNIGLLRLNKTVTYTDFIRPICLPIPGTVTPKVGDTMYLSDWGLSNDWSKDGIKRKILTQLIHEEECQRLFPAYYDIKHRNIICTVDYQNNTESANVVDDGPLMFDNNYRWYIVGLLWRPYKAAITYVNVLKYINWIIGSMVPW